MDERTNQVNTVPQTEESPLDYKLVGKIRGTFFVPRYQRGYRWDIQDVQRLLNDIWACQGKNYGLQPIVLKLRKKGNDEQSHEWELIDGQQRLTTLYLIFKYMQQQSWKKMGAPYLIIYETRPDTAAYLRTLDPARKEENPDYFHLYQAYECIDRWFQGKGDAYTQESVAGTFNDYLFKSVRVIWYEAPDDTHDNEKDSNALFTRLNVGRIPLTDAELIKAIVLSGVRKKQIERAEELAAQWDGIERDLHNPDVWAFIAGGDTGDDADKYPTRISLLLDTLSDVQSPLKPGEKRPRYHTFETLRTQIERTSEKSFWEDVRRLHAFILGWFDSPDLYNKIGFLIMSGFFSFGDIVKKAGSLTKRAFEQLLIEDIRNKLNVNKSGVLDLSYDKEYQKLFRLLLLMNVETVSRSGQRFPFSKHIGKRWSLEHIHAQNAESLTTVEQWDAWLKSHKKALEALPNQQALKALIQNVDAALQDIKTADNFGPRFQQVAAEVITVLTVPEPDSTASKNGLHMITNLALLSSEVNSKLSNSVFEVKRQMVLEIDRNMDEKDQKKDGYIPVCTRNVFLKYYPGADVQQMYFWGPKDKKSYYDAIVSMLEKANYLKPEESRG